MKTLLTAIILTCALTSQATATTSTITASPDALTSSGRPAETSVRKDDFLSSGMVFIPGGAFQMGTDTGFPYEAPVHKVSIKSFWMDRTEVTVAQFAQFVKATGYVTEAEKLGWSGVFSVEQGSWTKSDGADWQHPYGPETEADPQLPVVHVSYADANAFAKWAGKRLPTEAEWEYAARGGRDQFRYWWGNELNPGDRFMANMWQGQFPTENLGQDGYLRLAPVGLFPNNPYGLFDIAGNVWEWCSDYFGEDYYEKSPVDNPQGPTTGTERVLRGGAWLCSQNFCQGYRAAARNHTEPDSGLNNTGFRCARNAE